jgi:hypothetical protein
MPLVPFESLPDHARLWVFPGARALTAAEASLALRAADEFLDAWAAHDVPLASGRELRHDQFLVVSVDEAAAGPSGCSIDALVNFVRRLEGATGVTFTDNAPVWFRRADGGIEMVSRAEFRQRAKQGVVGPDTVVFDHTIQSLGALREGKWEVKARDAWHGRAFFRETGVAP